jgi:hypothetical protein
MVARIPQCYVIHTFPVFSILCSQMYFYALFHFSSLLLSLWNICFPLFCLRNKEAITVIWDYVAGFDAVQLRGAFNNLST